LATEDRDGNFRPVALPRWQSPELQRAVIIALIDGGADIHGPAYDMSTRPIAVAVRAANVMAVDILLSHDVRLRDDRFFMVMRLPFPNTGLRQTAQYEQELMKVYRRLIQHDRTLVTQTDGAGSNLAVYAALEEAGRYSQTFIEGYMTLLLDNGVDIAAPDTHNWGETPLYSAASFGSVHVADFLTRHLPSANDINRPSRNNTTPLTAAAQCCDLRNRRLGDQRLGPNERKRAHEEAERYKAIISMLLRAGADIGRMPANTNRQRRQRELVVIEYTDVLNDLSTSAMAALNAALAPHRSLAALLTPRLAAGPQEAAFFGWRIASYLFGTEAAKETITDTLTDSNTDVARRVVAAVEHFVKCAALRAISNREVVGAMADVEGQMVRVPLQCFAVRVEPGGQHRVLGVREVVHRARLDEAAKWGLAEGAVLKGFNTHLGNDDCQFAWGQLGYIDSGGQFVSLGID